MKKHKDKEEIGISLPQFSKEPIEEKSSKSCQDRALRVAKSLSFNDGNIERLERERVAERLE